MPIPFATSSYIWNQSRFRLPKLQGASGKKRPLTDPLLGAATLPWVSGATSLYLFKGQTPPPPPSLGTLFLLIVPEGLLINDSFELLALPASYFVPIP